MQDNIHPTIAKLERLKRWFKRHEFRLPTLVSCLLLGLMYDYLDKPELSAPMAAAAAVLFGTWPRDEK